MSNFTINKQDGSKTTFNFVLDNGLPVKPIINPAYEECFVEENNTRALCVYLTEEDLELLKEIKIDKNYSGENELWFLMNEHYIVLGNVSKEYIEEFRNKKINIYFLKEDKTFIKGVGF